MEQLPYIDEHSQRVDAPADEVWAALSKVLRRELGGSARIARILGCDPAQGTAEFAGRPGETVPGFRVVEAEPGRRLGRRGRPRFSSYAPTGVLGGLYRAVVSGSVGHGLATRRLLRQVARAT